MDLDNAQTLVTVVDTGSIRAAAETLGLTRPTVRRRLSALEDELGVRLVVSDTNTVLPTRAGSLYADHARRLLRDREALHTMVKNLENPTSGAADIAVPAGIGTDLAQQLIAGVLQAYPDFQFRLRAGIDPVGELSRGAQCALTYTRPTEGDFVVKVVLSFHLRLFASPEYVARRGIPQSLDDLGNHLLFHWSDRADPVDEWPLLDGGSFPIAPWLFCSNLQVVRHCVGAGLGIGLLPRFMGPGLQPVLPDLVGDPGHIWWVSTPALAADPGLRTLYSVLRPIMLDLMANVSTS